MKEIADMIASVGFPIVVSLGMFWFYSKMVDMLNQHYVELMKIFEGLLSKQEGTFTQIIERDGKNVKGN